MNYELFLGRLIALVANASELKRREGEKANRKSQNCFVT